MPDQAVDTQSFVLPQICSKPEVKVQITEWRARILEGIRNGKMANRRCDPLLQIICEFKQAILEQERAWMRDNDLSSSAGVLTLVNDNSTVVDGSEHFYKKHIAQMFNNRLTSTVYREEKQAAAAAGNSSDEELNFSMLDAVFKKNHQRNQGMWIDHWELAILSFLSGVNIDVHCDSGVLLNDATENPVKINATSFGVPPHGETIKLYFNGYHYEPDIGGQRCRVSGDGLCGYYAFSEAFKAFKYPQASVSHHQTSFFGQGGARSRSSETNKSRQPKKKVFAKDTDAFKQAQSRVLKYNGSNFRDKDDDALKEAIKRSIFSSKQESNKESELPSFASQINSLTAAQLTALKLLFIDLNTLVKSRGVVLLPEFLTQSDYAYVVDYIGKYEHCFQSSNNDGDILIKDWGSLSDDQFKQSLTHVFWRLSKLDPSKKVISQFGKYISSQTSGSSSASSRSSQNNNSFPSDPSLAYDVHRPTPVSCR